MRFVPVKTVEQQAAAMLHRTRALPGPTHEIRRLNLDGLIG
jgi:hypothetical protein